LANNNLAWIYVTRGAGDNAEAMKLALAASTKLPNQPEIVDTLGWIYYKANVPLATSTLEHAVALAPKSAVYQYHLGMSYAQDGQRAEARKTLTRALQLSDKFSGADEAKAALAQLGTS
jgi:tetratricopeptide (TPR) repeat protein